MSRKKKAYSAEYKSKIVLEMLTGEQTIAQIASKYEISAKSLIDWKKQFLDNASLAFVLALLRNSAYGYMMSAEPQRPIKTR